MKKLLQLCLILPALGHGQNFKALFDSAFQKWDSIEQVRVLEEWKSMGEFYQLSGKYYAAAFNFKINNARHEIMEITQDPSEPDALAILDSNENIEGHIQTRVSYDEANLEGVKAMMGGE